MSQSKTSWFGSCVANCSKESKTKIVQKDDIHLLQLEAEKIRNWHVQTEMNTKSMEKVVQNLRMTVESQRKSLLEVQIEYDSVSSRMHDEINKRTLCLQKINATRNMCNLIKTQSCELEETLNFCSETKKILETQTNEQTAAIQQLTSDYKLLSEEFESVKSDNARKLLDYQKKIEEDHSSFSEEIKLEKKKVEECNQKLMQDEAVIDVLFQSLNEANERIKQFQATNQHLVESKHELSTLINRMKLDLKVVDSVKKDQLILLKNKDEKIRKLSKNLLISEELQKDLEQKFDEKCELLEETESALLSKLSNIESNYAEEMIRGRTLNKFLEEKDIELQQCANQITSLNFDKQDLESKVLHLTDYKDDLLDKYNKLEDSSNNDHALINHNEEIIDTLTNEICQLKVEEESLQEKMNKFSLLQKDLQKEIEEKTNDNQSLKCQLNTTEKMLTNCNEQIKSYVEKQENLQTQLNNGSSENCDLKNKIFALEQQFSRSTGVEAALQSKLNALNKNVAEYENGNVESEEKFQALNSKLEEREKEISNFEEIIKKNKITIDDQTKALGISTRLYNELVIIRNDQTEELSNLYKELHTARDKLTQEHNSNLIELSGLRNEHAHEVLILQKQLQSTKDKLKTEKDLKMTKVTPSKLIKKPKNKHRFTPLNGHDISNTDFHECFAISPLKGVVCSKPPPKHSTPIQRVSKPAYYSTLGRKSASSKKGAWKQTPCQKTAKKLVNSKKVSSEDNWFDTDHIYGFFD